MFLSNTLALFGIPPTPPPLLHEPAVASSASSSASSPPPTNDPQPQEPSYYFPDSPHPPPLTEKSPASSRATVQKKQLVPKVIARCSAPPPPAAAPPPPSPPPPAQRQPAAATATAQTTTNLTRPPAEKLAGGGRGRGGIQQQHQTLPNRGQYFLGLEEIRKRYPWNTILFPGPPPTQNTPKIIIMLKDESSRRRTAAHTPPSSSPTPIIPQEHPSPRTPTKKSVLSYFASPAGRKFLDNLEQETKLEKERTDKKQKKDKKPPRPDLGGIAPSTSTAPGTSADAGGDRATHEPSLGKRGGIRRKSRGVSDAEIPNGRSPKPKECQEQETEELARSREKHVRHASGGHVATSVWNEHCCSQLPERHHIIAAAAGVARETEEDGAELADVFDGESPGSHTIRSTPVPQPAMFLFYTSSLFFSFRQFPSFGG